MRPRLAGLAVVVAALAAHAADRSPAAVAEFKRLNPCPATGKPRGACPGWVVDHIQPLCSGGADRPENMQWQTVEASKLKDRQEHRLCRDLKL